MNIHIVIYLVLIILTFYHVDAISYRGPHNGYTSAGPEPSSSAESESAESDETSDIREDIAGPEENPKCENSDEWPRLYPTCTGLKQSPINIRISNVQTGYKSVPPLCWTNYETIPKDTILYNLGHTIQMAGKWKTGEEPSISCGILGNSTYQFVQWHCHWAKNNHNGSEHTFHGRSYPMECHFVHFRKDFGTFQKAALQPNGIAVVAYLFDIKLEDTFPVDVLGSCMLKLVKTDNVTVLPLPLGVWAPTFVDTYVTYHGSLTTPPCSESVIWIINIKAQNITNSLMKKFRRVAQASHCMHDNFRQVQDLNGRDVILVPDKNLIF